MATIRDIFLVIALSALMVLIMTCNKEDDNSPDEMTGWATGNAHGGFATIYHTTDGGLTWERQGDAGMIPDADLQDIRAVDKNIVWASGNSADGYPLILRTDDGGKNWIRQGAGSGLPDIALFGICPVSRDVCWAAGDLGTIVKTTDGGNSWIIMKAAADYESSYTMIAAVDVNHAWAVGEGDTIAMIHYTQDGGLTWVRQGTDSLTTGNTPNALIDIHAVTAMHVWAVGPGQVIYTLDGGETWVNKPAIVGAMHNNGVCVASDADPHTLPDELVVWVATDYNQMYKLSGLYGDWVKQAPITGALSAMYMGVAAIDENTAWITSAGFSGAGQIFNTTDGGVKWVIQDIPEEISLRRITFAGGMR